jgi:hypothetical protein
MEFPRQPANPSPIKRIEPPNNASVIESVRLVIVYAASLTQALLLLQVAILRCSD